MEMGEMFQISSDDEEEESSNNILDLKLTREYILTDSHFQKIIELHPYFENDEEILSAAIGSEQRFFEYTSDKLKKNKEFLIKCIEKCIQKTKFENLKSRTVGFDMEYLKNFLDDKEIIKKLVEFSPSSFDQKVSELWKDEIFFEECLTLNPDLLKYVEVVNESLALKGLIKKPENLKYLKNVSKEFLTELLNNDVQIPWKFVLPFEYQNDEIFLELYLNITKSIDFLDEDIPNTILNNKKLIILMLKKSPNFLSKLNEKQKNDKELVKISIESNPLSLIYASDELKDDKNLVMYALENSKKSKVIVEVISDRLRGDRFLMIEAIKITAYAFIFATEELQFDLKFVVDSLDYNRNVLEYIDISFQKDIDIQMILEGMYHKLRLKNEKILSFSDMRFNYANQ